MKPYPNQDEAERLLKESGTASPRSVAAALPALLHGQSAGWAVTSVNDSTEKTIDPGDSFRHGKAPKEVDFRTRTITITLLETSGDYIEE